MNGIQKKIVNCICGLHSDEDSELHFRRFHSEEDVNCIQKKIVNCIQIY